MDNKNLQELLEALKSQDGGVVLRVGEKPEAVVLSIDKYNELLVSLAGMETAHALTNVATVTEVVAEVVPEQKPTVLVTGGAGYIGSHTVRLLQAHGCGVVVVDNLVTGKREFVPEDVPFYELDINNSLELESVIVEHEVTAIIHFAASLEVGESVEQPEKYFENNVLGTIAVARAASRTGVSQIVFSSTAAVYGEQDIVPIPESATLQPNNPYGTTKMLGEKILEYYAQSGFFTATVFRYFNVAGCNTDWGLYDTHARSHLIPVILEVAAGKEGAIRINGNDYPTFDGTCVRDYVHVMDVAQAHIQALEKGFRKGSFQVFNIGTGKGVSVSQMVTIAAEVTRRMIPIELGPRRSGDAAKTVADNKKITQELGFVPQYSNPELLIGSAWEHTQKQKSL